MNNGSEFPPSVQRLLDKGVLLPSPFSVEVEPSVNPEQIAPGAVIHTGCRISGERTVIGPGSQIGQQAPAAIENCQLGHRVELKGGYFSGATFLDGAAMESGAHVRPGTLLEEAARGAHTVGFKMTILLSYVTAGSLINFCDALMAGGTGKKDHSEIGSSYIHFNFTPHQDKATPSLIGDVPRGVFLDQPPIFLGGQGGLVGPARIAYGTVIPAGVICRRDVLEEGTLYAAPPPNKGVRTFRSGIYRGINRIVKNNLIYIGNLWALRAWYKNVRIRTMSSDIFRRACHKGALTQIEDGLTERVRRLRELAGKMPYSLENAFSEMGADLPEELSAQQRALVDKWPEMEARLNEGPPAATGAVERDRFLSEWEKTDTASGHTNAVGALRLSARRAGSSWLQGIVDSASALWTEI